jgi:tetratricopeptide (TPR) repeat protein
MYSVLLSLALALLLGLSGLFLDWWAWYWAIPITLVALVGAWILVVRRISAQLTPAMGRIQQQMQAGHLDAAMQSLEDLLPYGKWMPMLRGQLLAQMGMIAWHGGKKDKALALLEGASLRAGDARLLLAAILFKNGDAARALSVLQVAATVNKKHALLHNTWAWMLHKSERNDEAQQVLANFQKRDATSEPTKDNLLRLQNRTRMTMHGFGVEWFALGLEQMPQQQMQMAAGMRGMRAPVQGMTQQRRAPKGFREPPKGRG